MRYEVRRPDGRLIGLYNGPANMPWQFRLDVMSELNMLPAFGDQAISVSEERLSVREVVLEREKLLWGLEDNSVIEVPTLVLKSGKRTWLNDVNGFRRI